MKRNTLLLIIFLSLLTILSAYNFFAKPFQHIAEVLYPTPSPTVMPSPTPVTLDAQVEQIFASLTPEQKIAQLLAVPVVLQSDTDSELVDPATLAWIQSNQPGFMTVFGENIAMTAAQKAILELTADKNGSMSGEKNDFWQTPLVMVDHEGGSVQRLSGEGFTLLPSWQELCQTQVASHAAVLQQSAQELKAVGVEMILAPVIDFSSNHPILRSRVCGDDPNEVANQALGFIAAFQQQGVSTVIKHFPGIGQTTKDLHRNFDRVTVGEPEAIVVNKILESQPQEPVMVTHVGVNNQYPDIPCSLSASCVGELKTLYPKSLILTDALDMKAAAYNASPSGELRSLPEIAEYAAFANGAVLTFSPTVTVNDLQGVLVRLLQDYNRSSELKQKIDQNVKNILSFKLRQRVGIK